MARQLRIEFPGLFTTSPQEAMNAKPYLKVSVAVEENSKVIGTYFNPPEADKPSKGGQALLRRIKV